MSCGELSDIQFVSVAMQSVRYVSSTSVNEDELPTDGRASEVDEGYCALRRSQVRRTGQICLIDADKAAKFKAFDIVSGGVIYGGGGLSGIRDVRRSFPDTIGAVCPPRLFAPSTTRKVEEFASSSSCLD